MKNWGSKQNRLWLGIIGAVVLVITALGLLLTIAFRDRTNSTAVTKQKLHYVLVNSDEGASYNNVNYNLGQDFIKLINQDTKNSWQVTTADIANSGFNKGNYDAMIVIGPDFSRNLLSLQSVEPQKAQITYRVRNNQDRMSGMLLKGEVNSLLNRFNKRIVTMYFTSTVNNIADAQHNVSGIVVNETTNLSHLNKDVLTPLKTTPAGYQSLFSSTDSLSMQDKTWEEQQKTFTKMTQELLNANGKKLDDSAITLGEYVQLQKNLSKINATNANAAIVDQADKDEITYRAQYDKLNDRVKSELALLLDDNNQGLLANLKTDSEDFQKQQQANINRLKGAIIQANSLQIQLQNQRKTILENYTGNPNFNYDPAQPDQLRTAIIDHLLELLTKNDTFNDKYFLEIERDYSQIPIDDLDKMVDRLEAENVLDPVTAKQYRDESAIVRRFGKNRNLPVSGASIAVEANNTDLYTTTNSLTIDEKHSGRIIFAPNASLALNNLNDVVAQLNGKLPAGVTASVGSLPNQILLNVASPAPAPTATAYKITGLKLEWKWNDHNLNHWVETRNYDIRYDSGANGYVNEQSGTVSRYYKKLEESQVPNLLHDFSQATAILDRSSNQLSAIFAEVSDMPETRTEWLADKVRHYPFKTLIDIAPESSLYKQLSNLPYTYVKNFIETTLADNLLAKAEKQIGDNSTAQRQLESVVGVNAQSGLKKLNADMISPDRMLTQYDKLVSWLTTARTAIDTEYGNWKKNPAKTIKSVRWEGTDNKRDIYYDDTKGNELYNSFQEFAKSSRSEGSSVVESAAEIKPLSPQIKTVISQVKDIKEATDASLAKANDLVATTTTQTTKHTKYNENFSKVFKNAQPGSRNRESVYDFLSTPIKIKNESKRGAQDSIIPYLLTVITALVTFFAAIAFSKWARRLQVTEEDGLLEKTLALRNVKSLGILSAFSLGLGIIFTAAVHFGVLKLSISWWVAVIALVVSLTMITTYLVRQLRTLGVGTWALLFGIFLVLTPVIGVTVKANSWVAGIFKLSPFQHVQVFYASAVNHQGVGVTAGAVLGLLLIIGILANLFIVKKGENTGADNQEIGGKHRSSGVA